MLSSIFAMWFDHYLMWFRTTTLHNEQTKQVDFPSGHETFHSHLFNGQGIQPSANLVIKKSKLRPAQGKQNLGATCLKGKLEFK